MSGMRPLVRLATVTPLLEVPPSLARPVFASVDASLRRPPPSQPQAGDAVYDLQGEAFAKIRAAAKIAAKGREFAASLVAPGVTTDFIDVRTHEYLTEELGAYPAPLEYPFGPDLVFPKSICTSVNDVMVHGVPDMRPLEEGDIVSIDVSVFKDGFYGDNCTTVGVGEIDESAQRLISTAKACVEDVIRDVVRPNVELVRVADEIERIAAEAGFLVNGHFCGHGVGEHLHMMPFVFSTRDTTRRTRSMNVTLPVGTVITIEPAILEPHPTDPSRSSSGQVGMEDRISVRSVNGARSAQFEHQVAVTPEGYEILTIP